MLVNLSFIGFLLQDILPLILSHFAFTGDSSSWQSGLFDNKSFSEIMAGWAPTVVCGRARFDLFVYCSVYCRVI